MLLLQVVDHRVIIDLIVCRVIDELISVLAQMILLFKLIALETPVRWKVTEGTLLNFHFVEK